MRIYHAHTGESRNHDCSNLYPVCFGSIVAEKLTQMQHKMERTRHIDLRTHHVFELATIYILAVPSKRVTMITLLWPANIDGSLFAGAQFMKTF